MSRRDFRIPKRKRAPAADEEAAASTASVVVVHVRDPSRVLYGGPGATLATYRRCCALFASSEHHNVVVHDAPRPCYDCKKTHASTHCGWYSCKTSRDGR
jgi:hypothetical protein